MKNTNRGFTLIELLVVIAIIGILSSVVLASLNSARQKSRDARRISDMKQLQLALELYFDANSTYPATTGWDAALEGAGVIPTVPTDPLGGDYAYELISATQFCLGADLEQIDHVALSSDSDLPQCVDVVVSDSNSCTAGGTGYCYDITQ